ncbi:GIY-YIG nuclease family protein [Sinorhizobium numidicum]|uniref:GIY-YIG nuclease family protein n=1 Tax=Sinorhizobium numidicum TaxID=680248 RepID=A0ABY8CZK9_9HYPH|nr:GIY-YIG nuclease family protein [Sinorhizobium numidicum]WEX76661.1 GIY-YIG nuclease family protein [Sinorhizobium numidicum]WEX83322.1 GIY-YIG nuclease family protein [Sinorhizobium numidicum]
MVHGRSVRLYLVDGSPTGIITAEIMNWTGHVLVTPRSRLAEALQRGEATRTGVYFLVGDDPEQPSKSRVYIGEGDSVVDRIKSHSKDSQKDFWTRACLVTSKDTNLTKAHVRYLENRFVELTKLADRANVANGNEPARKSLPESDVADMEFFIDQVQVILPVVGFDFLRPKAHAQIANTIDESPAGTGIRLDLVMTSGKYGYEARAIELDGEITVLAGSRGTTESFATNIYASLRQQLINDGRLVHTDDPNFVEFSEDVTFASPSAAAAVIKNRNTNGRTAWRLVGAGQSLKEWQDSQLGIPSGDN